jgi:cell division protease FtsH
MDGFETNEGVILIAATNRPDVLDPALLRPGRFDRTVVVALPDLKGRREILDVHIKKVPLDEDVNLDVVARGTPGFSGADVANLVNEAALYAALKDKDHVDMSHFEYARDKIMMGVERKSLVLTENDKKVTAYHEAGHALIARLIPETDPVHKVTIIPRGMALGVTQLLPEHDKHSYKKQYLLDKICITFGGRAAEELVFGEITNGASGDISVITGIARRMVCEWGMSEKLGPIAFGAKEGAVFLGKELTHEKNYSESTASMIDEEVRVIVDIQLARARELLGQNRNKLERLAQALLESETLDLEQVDKIINQED